MRVFTLRLRAKTHTETTEVLLSPDQSDAQTKPLSLSLFVCFFVSLFAYSGVGRPVELLNSQEEEEEEEEKEESQSESESQSSSSKGGHLFSYKYCKHSE